MIKNLDELEPTIISKIIKDYEVSHMSVNNLADKYSLERNVILAILNNRVKVSDLPNGYINGDTFIVIGDTHIGSALEKLNYLDYVYEFASKNNIHDIINVGDLIQSTMRPVQPKYVKEKAQVDHLVRDYPRDANIKNHILFGNHDFHILSRSTQCYRVIASRKDFNLLGFKRAYLGWQKHLICIDHPINKYHINIPNYDPLIRLVGHSHSFHIKEPNNIYTPALSLDQKYYSNQIPYPGFLVISKCDKKAQITLYVFQEHIHNTQDLSEVNLVRESKSEAISYGVVRTLKMRDNMTIGKR